MVEREGPEEALDRILTRSETGKLERANHIAESMRMKCYTNVDYGISTWSYYGRMKNETPRITIILPELKFGKSRPHF